MCRHSSLFFEAKMAVLRKKNPDYNKVEISPAGINICMHSPSLNPPEGQKELSSREGLPGLPETGVILVWRRRRGQRSGPRGKGSCVFQRQGSFLSGDSTVGSCSCLSCRPPVSQSEVPGIRNK